MVNFGDGNTINYYIDDLATRSYNFIKTYSIPNIYTVSASYVTNGFIQAVQVKGIKFSWGGSLFS